MKDRSEIGIVAATTRYEAWLAERIPLVKPDLDLKHHAMSAGIFPFLRATFYRWAVRWRALVGDVAAAPTVLAVGDLHVENFGPWREGDTRSCWRSIIPRCARWRCIACTIRRPFGTSSSRVRR